MVGVIHITALTIIGVIIHLITEVTIRLTMEVGVIIHRYMLMMDMDPIMGIGDLQQQIEGFLKILIALNRMFIIPEQVVQAGEQAPIVHLLTQEQETSLRPAPLLQIGQEMLPGIRMET